ncbi:MAG: hypothetical protein P8078_01755, partial [bacterium]
TLIGFLTDNDIQALIDSVQSDYNYIIIGRFWEKFGILNVEVRLLNCQLRSKEHTITISGTEMLEGKTIQEILSDKITEHIEMFLTAKICIGLIDFKMMGGDSVFKFFEESIPTMLATGLSASGELKLIEIKSEMLLKDMIESGSRGIFDLTTTLNVGKKINANYLIMGEYWERGNEIRIDARCINIETAEIILSEYIILDGIDISTITERISELASKIRILIEKNFLRREERLRSIAVICFPPSSNNRLNVLRTECIRKTLVRKLRLGSDLPIKDDPEKINRYLKVKEDKLKICSDLEVYYLLTIQYETIADDMIVLDIDLYDINNPFQDVFRETKTLNYKTADNYINQIVLQTLRYLHPNKPITDKYQEIKSIKLPMTLTRWSFGMKYAFLWRTKTGNDLYLKAGAGDYFELFLNYYFNDRVQLECHIGYDDGNRDNTIIPKNPDSIEVQRSVWGMQMGLVLKYDLAKIFTFNLYTGLGGSFIQVFRNNVQENGEFEDLAGKPGLGLISLMGLDIEMKKIGVSFYAEPRYIFGIKVKDKTKTHIGMDIPGGRLGGFYMMLGIGYHFNL